MSGETNEDRRWRMEDKSKQALTPALSQGARETRSRQGDKEKRRQRATDGGESKIEDRRWRMEHGRASRLGNLLHIPGTLNHRRG
jgi:hypothetical protein